MRRRFAAGIGVAGLLLAGCASTVPGTGSAAADATKPSARATARPTTSPSASPTARSTLKCSPTVISPAGSPYCFTVPEGFQDVSSSVSVDASIGNEKFRSAVAVGNRDLIIVTVYQLIQDTDDIAADTLEGELRKVLAQLAQQGFTFDSTIADRGEVDGARSFAYHARQAKNMLESDIYFVFRGRNEIEVNCQWKDKAAEVQKGCQAVLKSIQVK